MGEKNHSVLLVDDDQSLRSATAMMLREEGYSCLEASNGLDAISLFRRISPDLIILDVMMPQLDGFETCERIRELDEHVPILFLSVKGDIVDKRTGFKAGADDYLVKPFSMEELTLKVGALLRRSHLGSSREGLNAVRVFAVDDLEVDLHEHEVKIKGRRVDLTPKELRIVITLARRAGETVSKEELIDAVWGEEFRDTAVELPVHIRRIREKIEPDPKIPQYLQTAWGQGYRLG